jgi:hypothetical protein
MSELLLSQLDESTEENSVDINLLHIYESSILEYSIRFCI